MAKFTNCLQIVNAMPEQDQDALLARLDELQAQGLSPKEAQLQAAIDVLAQVERESGMRKSASRAPDLFPGEFADLDSTISRELVVSSKGATETIELPNVNSAGRQITGTLQGLSNFWDWYGDGPTDSKGRPILLYHSTNADIAEFETGRETTNNFGLLGNITVTRAGIFASPSLQFSQDYLRDGSGGNVMPIYMAFQNPLDLRRGLTEADEAALEGAGLSPRFINTVKNDWSLFDNDDDGKNEFVEALRRAGYDGAIIEEDSPTGESDGGDTYIAFDKTQIKSAIGNVGRFDPANPDIRKSPERDANFKRWTRGLPVIEADYAGDYDGGPAVFQAYHGTTHTDITEFKNIGDKQGALGQGPYFSTSITDVNENYAGVGPDLTSRIGREVDNVAQGFDDDAWYATDVLQAYFDDNGIDTEITDDNIEELKDEHRDKAIEHAAMKALKGDSDGLVMPVYVRLEKPFNMAGNPTYFEMTYPVNEDGDSDYEAEPEGSAVDLINAINEVASGYGADADSLTGWVYMNGSDGISAREVWDRAAKDMSELYDDNGDLISSGQFMQEVAREMGFDGLIQDADAYFGTQRRGFGGIRAGAMKGVQPGTLHIMPFDGTQVKSETGNSGEFGENRSILKSPERPQFFSQLQRAIEQVPARLDNMGAMAWKQWLTANAPKLGVKAEEVEWSGIKDFLDLQGKRKLSKDELSGYLDDSGVKVSEVTLGGDGFYRDANGQRVFDDETGDFVGSKNPGTKYENYTLPGGENYRELLITLPGGVSGKELAELDERIQELEDDRDGADEDERDAIDQRIFAVQAERKQLLGKGYRSSHWDEPNVLAHIRINDRTDADGGRVLFVEEVQSDFGQDFKKAKDAINKAVDSDFLGIVERMKAAGVLEVECD